MTRISRHRFFLSVGLSLALLQAWSGQAYSLGLEKISEIVPIGTETPLLNPSGFWHDNLRDVLVVANTPARQLLVLRSSGEVVRAIETGADFPVAVAGNRERNLIISEKNSENLKVLAGYDSPASAYLSPIDLSPFRQSRPVQPTALFLGDNGDLAVVDRGNRQVLILDLDGKLRFSIRDVDDPVDVWIEEGGNILVADPGSGGVRVYSSNGKWMRTIGSFSPQLNQPIRPKTVTADNRRRIWVVEEDGTLRAFDSVGNLLHTSQQGIFGPADLAFGTDFTLYLLDGGANRIYLFSIREF